jgi:NADH-quinone oxidoreductase subunit N
MSHFLTQDAVAAFTSALVGSLTAFSPELVLIVGILGFLLIRLFPAADRLHLGYVAIGVVVIALWLGWTQWQGFLQTDVVAASAARISDGKVVAPALPSVRQEMFFGMLVNDPLSVFMRLLLLVACALVVLMTLLTGIPDSEDSADFYTLLLGSTLGMTLMASANHLLMVFIAVEMASLPSYALAGFLKGRRQSSEAALKYVVYGGAAAGVMLYGISLIVGKFGTGYLPDVSVSFLTSIQGGFDPFILTGVLLVLVGLAFKLSAVPFHFWCPDVFEGAAAEVGGFLSVASKAAAIALTGRFVLVFTGGLQNANEWTFETWKAASAYVGPALAFLGAITATFGNLAAYTQTNVKRLLAYSTIAHAGYMIMALATLTPRGLDAALLYLVVYIAMNLGAFGVVAFLRNRFGTEEISGYAGMIRRAPLQTLCMAVFFLSLVGMPPFAGYLAKFDVFASIYSAASEFHNRSLYFLLVVGLVNTVVSLFYYVKVLKVMIIDPAPEGAVRESTRTQPVVLQAVFSCVLAAFVTVGMILPTPPHGTVVWDGLTNQGTHRAVSPFLAPKMPAAGAVVTKPAPAAAPTH